jgi:hypothetical protein
MAYGQDLASFLRFCDLGGLVTSGDRPRPQGGATDAGVLEDPRAGGAAGSDGP